MRTIKFKGECTCPKCKGKIACGSLLTFPDGTVRIFEHDHDTIFNYFTVDPATVSQFTGCIDKNGKEIYEGDILGYNNSTFAVEWSENLGAFTLRPIREKGKCDDIPLGVILKYIRFIIIGNIHDRQKGGEDAGNNDNI